MFGAHRLGREQQLQLHDDDIFRHDAGPKKIEWTALFFHPRCLRLLSTRRPPLLHGLTQAPPALSANRHHSTTFFEGHHIARASTYHLQISQK